MKTLIIDNYDSFVYNLVQYFGEAWWNPIVFRNDKITLEKVISENPSHIVISPWPWNPTNPEYFWVCNEIILKMWKNIPILWVCLWHQWIWACFGWDIITSLAIMHWKTSKVYIENESKLLKWIKSPFEVMRYHSLAVDPKNLSKDMLITSKTEDWTVMSFEHKKYPIYWVQFHPESIGTSNGKTIIQNFLGF